MKVVLEHGNAVTITIEGENVPQSIINGCVAALFGEDKTGVITQHITDRPIMTVCKGGEVVVSGENILKYMNRTPPPFA